MEGKKYKLIEVIFKGDYAQQTLVTLIELIGPIDNRGNFSTVQSDMAISTRGK